MVVQTNTEAASRASPVKKRALDQLSQCNTLKDVFRRTSAGDWGRYSLSEASRHLEAAVNLTCRGNRYSNEGVRVACCAKANWVLA